MVHQLIEYGHPLDASWRTASNGNAIAVSEVFYDTIQGEGIFLGTPAAFLRLAGCTLDCRFCDTREVWKASKRVDVDDLLGHIFESGMAQRLSEGHHLVVTGGSPLLQQDMLVSLLTRLRGWIPTLFVELENECTLVPSAQMLRLVDHWNNSPKLANSMLPREKRYHPEAVSALADSSSTFKFVISSESDWNEIEKDFIIPGLVRKNQICLMPMGADRTEYSANRELVVDLAVRHGVRYSPREHIAIWDKKTGI